MTFIIAEVGSNWLTNDDCIASIKAAKECGADEVKFQMYTHKELYGYDQEERGYIVEKYPGGKTEEHHYARPYKLPGELSREWIPQLAKACEHYGIEFMCTAFSPEGYRFIDPYVKRHKIASAENTDQDILKTVSEFGKPILVSTGGSSIEGIKEFLSYLPTHDVTLMYCVSAYPALNSDVGGVQVLRNLFYQGVGYSCHTSEWITPVYAVHAYHADVVEKHFKVRPMYTPDSDHSILPEDFKKMVTAIRRGLTVEFPDPQEDDMVRYHKRRYIPELGGYFRTKKPE